MPSLRSRLPYLVIQLLSHRHSIAEIRSEITPCFRCSSRRSRLGDGGTECINTAKLCTARPYLPSIKSCDWSWTQQPAFYSTAKHWHVVSLDGAGLKMVRRQASEFDSSCVLLISWKSFIPNRRSNKGAGKPHPARAYSFMAALPCTRTTNDQAFQD